MGWVARPALVETLFDRDSFNLPLPDRPLTMYPLCGTTFIFDVAFWDLMVAFGPNIVISKLSVVHLRPIGLAAVVFVEMVSGVSEQKFRSHLILVFGLPSIAGMHFRVWRPEV